MWQQKFLCYRAYLHLLVGLCNVKIFSKTCYSYYRLQLESNVRRHVLNAFREGELERDDNNVHFLHVNGVKKPVPFYSLDVIISVGYRVHSKRGTSAEGWCEVGVG